MKEKVEIDKDGKIQLRKVVVRMGDRDVNLTIEQARELCALLKGLFGDDSTKMIHVQEYLYGRPWYCGPNWTYSGSNWRTWMVPCGGSAYSGSSGDITTANSGTLSSGAVGTSATFYLAANE